MAAIDDRRENIGRNNYVFTLSHLVCNQSQLGAIRCFNIRQGDYRKIGS